MRTENNKLIAEFMGLSKVPCSIGTENGIVTEGYMHPKCGVPMTANGLQYDSWDWLMPVVDKIENFGFEFFIVEDRVKIAHNTDHSIKVIIDFTSGRSKIETVYQGIVEFINWYNKNQ